MSRVGNEVIRRTVAIDIVRIHFTVTISIYTNGGSVFILNIHVRNAITITVSRCTTILDGHSEFGDVILDDDLVEGTIHVVRCRSGIELNNQIEGATSRDDTVKALKLIAAIDQFQGSQNRLITLCLQSQRLVGCGSGIVGYGDDVTTCHITVVDGHVLIAFRCEIKGGAVLASEQDALQNKAIANVHLITITIIEYTVAHLDARLQTTHTIFCCIAQCDRLCCGRYLVGSSRIDAVDNTFPVTCHIIFRRLDVVRCLQRGTDMIPKSSGIHVVGNLGAHILAVVGSHVRKTIGIEATGIPAHSHSTVGQADIAGIASVVVIKNHRITADRSRCTNIEDFLTDGISNGACRVFRLYALHTEEQFTQDIGHAF